MKLTISSQSQFGMHICQYLYDMDSNFAKENQSLPLQDIVAHILYATNRIRMGNEPITTKAIARITDFINKSLPISVACVFGDEESEKDYIDISELQSLQTLKDINSRVKQFYAPGLKISLQVVGRTSYVEKVTKLATVLGGFTIGNLSDVPITVSFAHYRTADFYYKSIPSKNILRGGYIPAWDGKGYLHIESPHEIRSAIVNNGQLETISTTVTLEDNGTSVDLQIAYLIG